MDQETQATQTTQPAASDQKVKVDEILLKETLEVIRPSLVADGGDMEYIGVDDDGVVTLRLTGACAGCPMSSLTLSMGIERILREHVPGVTRVQAEM
ncbi:MAG: NifU family protein [Atopobium sp.]|uniref:NifU family protein n=1 Tax=Atopobium sp. TaxID=1872650 RepID=UPI002A75F769|nr:NifU family protein [Atopobium sp.]MDY2788481.1 NifU family protein [Atopobium sp.]MDY4523205.1 NifU family protein [Atopobium sp.]